MKRDQQRRTRRTKQKETNKNKEDVWTNNFYRSVRLLSRDAHNAIHTHSLMSGIFAIPAASCSTSIKRHWSVNTKKVVQGGKFMPTSWRFQSTRTVELWPINRLTQLGRNIRPVRNQVSRSGIRSSVAWRQGSVQKFCTQFHADFGPSTPHPFNHIHTARPKPRVC